LLQRIAVLVLVPFAALANEVQEIPNPVDGDPRAPAAIDEIRVTTSRVETPVVEVPAAVAVVGRDGIQLARQQLSVAEALGGVPGIFVQNRTNFAQDARIAIRGFGARANFGIRGIKLIVDGIPATLPDGQGQVDSIDLASAERIEILRGPSASLYGSASGGVIRVESERGPPIPFVSGRAAFGSYDYRSYGVKAGGEAGPLNGLLSVSRNELGGYRDHSSMENLLVNSRLGFRFDESADLGAVLNLLHAPEAQDPGGLNAGEVAADRRQASARNLLFDAGESVDQASGGLRFRKRFGQQHETRVMAYGVWREFRNKLPFESGGAVELNRFFGGGGLEHVWRDEWFGRGNRLVVGFEVDAQRDHRIRRDNLQGNLGARTLDQDEDVTGLHLFLEDAFRLSDDVELTLGVGYDRVELDVRDRFLADGDDSGSGHFDEWSPMIALHWRVVDAFQPYGRISSAFEPPTTTELANPSGAGGFNPDLGPQRAVNFELGAKGLLPGRLRWDLAAFHIRIEDELVPFELPGMPGRSFFANAGRSSRTGIELGVTCRPLAWLSGSLAYTWSLFEFERFESVDGVFDGNRTPGVPEHQLFFQLEARHHWGLYAIWDVQFVDEIYADNANTVATDAYAVTNLRLGWSRRVGSSQRWELGPFVGMGNLSDTEYIDNLRINAFGGRYFEPAPERNFYGGISLAYHFGGEPMH
jgi:iron complex outermembrane receptor protein